MTNPLLIEQAMALPPDERVALARTLFHSIEDGDGSGSAASVVGATSEGVPLAPSPPSPRRNFRRPKLNANGKLVPLTEEESQAYIEASNRALDAIGTLVDQSPPGTDEEFMRAIDARRPHRPLFEGLY